MKMHLLLVRLGKTLLMVLIGYTCFTSTIVAQTALLDSLSLDTLTAVKSLEEALKHPEQVLKLELKRKKLKSIPPEIFTLPNLQYLDLSKNNITELPPELGKLKNLQHLNVSKNKLEQLPPQLGELVNLTYLNINQNELYTLPAEIGKLEKLSYLDAWSNNLDKLPFTLSHLKNLKTFDLRSIVITEKEQRRIQSLLPKTKIYFSNSCQCQQ